MWRQNDKIINQKVFNTVLLALWNQFSRYYKLIKQIISIDNWITMSATYIIIIIIIIYGIRYSYMILCLTIKTYHFPCLQLLKLALEL